MLSVHDCMKYISKLTRAAPVQHVDVSLRYWLRWAAGPRGVDVERDVVHIDRFGWWRIRHRVALATNKNREDVMKVGKVVHLKLQAIFLELDPNIRKHGAKCLLRKHSTA